MSNKKLGLVLGLLMLLLGVCTWAMINTQNLGLPSKGWEHIIKALACVLVVAIIILMFNIQSRASADKEECRKWSDDIFD